MLAALIWASIVATLGYFFGTAFEAVIDDAKHYELTAIIVIAAVGAILGLLHIIHRRRKYRSEKSDTPAE